MSPASFRCDGNTWISRLGFRTRSCSSGSATSTRRSRRTPEIAAEVLDIVLTSREMGKGQRVPLAGIPYHAAEGYIARLIAAGHKVAICEQVGEVTRGKGLVERDVTRVVTPGTVDEPAMLDARRNNYIAGLIVEGNRVGLAAADITTGEFIATEIGGQTIADALMTAGRELLRLAAGGNCPAGRRQRRSFARSRSRLAPGSGDPFRVGRLAVAAGPRRGDSAAPLRGRIAGRIRLRRQATRDPRGRRSAPLPARHAADRAQADHVAAHLLHRRVHDARPADAAQPGAARKRRAAKRNTA